MLQSAAIATATAALLLAAAALGPGGRAAAQGSGQPHRVWLAAGLAGSVSTSDAVESGAGILAQIVYQRRGHHFALRGLGVGDVYGNSSRGLGEIGLIYGRAITTGSGHAALATGLAGVAFETCPDDDDSCFAVGVPLVAEVGLSLEFVGLGLQAFGNLNPKAPYGGLALIVQFGWLDARGRADNSVGFAPTFRPEARCRNTMSESRRRRRRAA